MRSTFAKLFGQGRFCVEGGTGRRDRIPIGRRLARIINMKKCLLNTAATAFYRVEIPMPENPTKFYLNDFAVFRREATAYVRLFVNSIYGLSRLYI